MKNEKLINRLSEALGVEQDVAELSFNIFIEETAKKLKVGETLSVEGVGFFQKHSEDELRFVDVLEENSEKLFEKIEIPKKEKESFDLDEDLFSPSLDSSAVNFSDKEQLEKLSEIENKVAAKVNEFEVLNDFDIYSLAIEKDLTEESQEEVPADLEDDLEEELSAKTEEEPTELDENLQKELEEELMSDLEEENEEEPSLKEEQEEEQENTENESNELEGDNQESTDENDEPEVENKEEENTESEQEQENDEKQPEHTSQENEIIDEEELKGIFDDDEEESSKDDDNQDTEGEEGKKKKSLFGFLKRKGKKDKKEKKEKKPKKEKKKKKKDKEGEGEEESEKKKGLSKKLLIILIAVFVVLTAGGVYYFFFMGDEGNTTEETVAENKHEAKAEEEHGGEHEKMSLEDSLALHRKRPLTPEEIGEHRESGEKIVVDINNPENAKDESFLIQGADLEDPLSMKEFPHEVKISNTIYKADGKYMVQVSSWKRSSRALKIVQKLRRAGYNAFIVKAYLPALGGTWYRVRIGFFKTEKEAREFMKKREYLNVR